MVKYYSNLGNPIGIRKLTSLIIITKEGEVYGKINTNKGRSL
jgi:hypothetical protein